MLDVIFGTVSDVFQQSKLSLLCVWLLDEHIGVPQWLLEGETGNSDTRKEAVSLSVHGMMAFHLERCVTK